MSISFLLIFPMNADPFEAPRPQPRRCWANPTSWDPLRVYLKRVDEDEKLKTELKAWETHSVLGVSGGIGIPFKKAAMLDWRKTMKNGGSLVVSWIHRKFLRLVWAVWDLLSRIVSILKFEPITFLGKVAMFAHSKAQVCWNHCYFHVTRAHEKMPSCQFTSTL